MTKVDGSIGKEILEKVFQVFKNNNCIFSLDYGTLLGYIRDKSFINGDNDIDFGVLYEDWKPKIITDLCDNGFILRKVVKCTNEYVLGFLGYDKVDTYTQVSFIYNDIIIDIEIYHKGINEYSKMRYYWGGWKNYIFEIPEKLIIPRIMMKFHNTDVYVPEKYKDYLKFIYGDSWKRPILGYIDSPLHQENRKRFCRSFSCQKQE